MGIRQKFFALAGAVGLLLAVVSVVGFITAKNNLEESISQEIRATIRAQGEELEGWLSERGIGNLCSKSHDRLQGGHGTYQIY